VPGRELMISMRRLLLTAVASHAGLNSQCDVKEREGLSCQDNVSRLVRHSNKAAFYVKANIATITKLYLPLNVMSLEVVH
jgi:hypothetical protein